MEYEYKAAKGRFEASFDSLYGFSDLDSVRVFLPGMVQECEIRYLVPLGTAGRTHVR